MSVRLHAIVAANELGDQALIKAVATLCEDTSGGIRLNALEVVVRHKVPNKRQLLKHALLDEKDYIRRKAAKLLESL